jgi:hypothetical protein
MKMDLQNEIDSLSIIGLVDPFNTKESLKDLIAFQKSWVDQFSIAYPDNVMEPIKEIVALEENQNKIIAPACIFIPSVNLVRVIARAILKYG